ncbi:hypothetical protein EU528_10110 [Candidatus Thorarchaeota archaeon]|nr:MAG: hypothetical protein EU528_10110 [Candidatus Thorarchaeota archaeon]
MYQKYSITKPEDREHSGACPSARFLNEAKYMTGLLLQDASNQIDRVEILSQQKMMADALDNLWREVEEGSVRVQSIAVLRAAKNVSCPEIANKLKSPNIDHARVVRDLRLLINTFEYVIKPEIT